MFSSRLHAFCFIFALFIANFFCISISSSQRHDCNGSLEIGCHSISEDSRTLAIYNMRLQRIELYDLPSLDFIRSIPCWDTSHIAINTNKDRIWMIAKDHLSEICLESKRVLKVLDHLCEDAFSNLANIESLQHFNNHLFYRGSHGFQAWDTRSLDKTVHIPFQLDEQAAGRSFNWNLSAKVVAKILPNNKVVAKSLTTGKIAYESEFSSKPECIAIHDSNTILVATADRHISACSIEGDLLWKLKISGDVYHLAACPKLKHIIAACKDHEGDFICRINTTTGQYSTFRIDSSNPIADIRFRHDGQHYALALIDGTVYIYNSTGKRTAELNGHQSPYFGMKFLADTSLLLITHRSVAIWNANTGECINQIGGNVGDIKFLEFTKDGKHLWAGYKHVAAAKWNICSSHCEQSYVVKPQIIESAISSDFCFLAYSYIGGLAMVDLKTKHIPLRLCDKGRSLVNGEDMTCATRLGFAFLPNKKQFVFQENTLQAAIRVWDIRNSRSHTVLKNNGFCLWKTLVSPDVNTGEIMQR